MLLIARCFSCRNIKRCAYNYMDYSGYIALENHIMWVFFDSLLRRCLRNNPHKCGFVQPDLYFSTLCFVLHCLSFSPFCTLCCLSFFDLRLFITHLAY